MLNAEGVYELDGTERKEESKQKADCGEIITTKYFVEGNLEPVRVDKTVNVDAVFMMGAFVKL